MRPLPCTRELLYSGYHRAGRTLQQQPRFLPALPDPNSAQALRFVYLPLDASSLLTSISAAPPGGSDISLSRRDSSSTRWKGFLSKGHRGAPVQTDLFLQPSNVALWLDRLKWLSGR
ncbi:hypothetical protein NDU88_007751 [Pleurodeles waltl]|uniref:Uncharacterized protein n=1 Tax=Pleurodeles waltl TaxID=8319 RepID=A0AAV7RVS7_PLEWA|nr:hypothetical protein NDU88_007751 [Pleurodeles waltl]